MKTYRKYEGKANSSPRHQREDITVLYASVAVAPPYVPPVLWMQVWTALTTGMDVVPKRNP
jgi:hypothetical protein